jgi:hypothetical protein
MACFKIGDIIPSLGNIKAGSTDVIRIMNGPIQVWPCITISIICSNWNSITDPECYYDENDNLVCYNENAVSGQIDFYKYFLAGEIIDTTASTARVLYYTAQSATNLIPNSSELPTPDPIWEGVLYETTDTNTIYKYSVSLNIWVPVPYGQETTTYNVDPVTWKINFDYTPPYIGRIGDPTAPENPRNIQNTNIHPILTMTLGGNLVTTGGRVIPINETSVYTSILQERESESNNCQNFRTCYIWALTAPSSDDEGFPSVFYIDCNGDAQTISIGSMFDPPQYFCAIAIGSTYLPNGSTLSNTEEICPPITGNICGTWSSDMNPMGNNTWESLTSGSVDFSSVLNGETISTIEVDNFGTSIIINSYSSIGGNIYNISPIINWTDGSNIVDFNFTNLQGTDDKPVDTLYFTGTIYTDAGRRLRLNVTSQYGLFIPGTSGGGTSYAQSC